MLAYSLHTCIRLTLRASEWETGGPFVSSARSGEQAKHIVLSSSADAEPANPSSRRTHQSVGANEQMIADTFRQPPRLSWGSISRRGESEMSVWLNMVRACVCLCVCVCVVRVLRWVAGWVDGWIGRCGSPQGKCDSKADRAGHNRAGPRRWRRAMPIYTMPLAP